MRKIQAREQGRSGEAERERGGWRVESEE